MNTVTRQQISAEIIKIAKLLNQKNYLASADGNISYRWSNDEIIITPTGKNKAWICEDDLAIISIDNKIIRGNPSGERLLHLEVYKNHPEAKAVVHAHPPTAIAWSIAKPNWNEIPIRSLSEGILALGKIPIAPYARPGTQAMADSIRNPLSEARVCIMARHGAVAWGEDLLEAYNGIERLEHLCIILEKATQLGGIHDLPEEEFCILQEMRKQLGPKIL